ncbi:HAD-like protein [Punctularia strigosozonata HHB-11173 SS5]|uniref:HAD-like protein n=1 Tax=Punctularia strigosozonata (strain HHB-11173) TaxID=741275 RepID=UPI0004418323|nr:HAD-like protein [Punctularia strigosozonata HHB-11173 SS5]EIN13024.1 HAD-like protein [Punctularia strigosozonata HHB-11173 SS5]
MSTQPQTKTSEFYADAVLFDMDGTLTDSIQAVEAAWGKVAKDIGHDPAYVIAATHGKRAVDNLAHFKPDIKEHEMDDEVANFEETILYYADAYNRHGPGSRRNSTVGSPISGAQSPMRLASSGDGTPALTPSSSTPSSRAGSFSVPSMIAGGLRRPSFLSRLSTMLNMTTMTREQSVFEEPESTEEEFEIDPAVRDSLEAWQIEATAVDRSVQILPGVKRMIDSIPEGRYAVATSGAKTYAYGCMTRVGITPPPVTITADDKRLKAGKPAPDPFLLAAECLGFDPKKCVVFEDSPSGIKAGVASGATVIALCTSHDRSKIENCGAHFIVENMEKVKCEPVGEGKDMRLKFTVEH